jgi:mono/diheme cytochrome c family protein
MAAMRIGTLFLLGSFLVTSTAFADIDPKIVRTWKAKCAACHGADGKADTESGKKFKISDMTKPEWQKSKTDDQLKTSIETGIKKDGKEMEAFKDKLTPEQITGLIAYIRTLK